MQDITINQNATLTELCFWYTLKAQYESSINEVEENMYNLCSKFLLDCDNITQKEMEAIKKHFNKA